jgi:hypothetical protein|tara:strand:- start:440 stop:1018 length:579 start_codon:yes stop_codon:yes gene_type:complete
MASITTRAGKGSPLTHDQVDDNFVNLNDGKIELIQNVTATGVTMDKSADFILYLDSASNTTKKILASNSSFIERAMALKAIPDTIEVYTGDGIARMVIPSTLNGLSLNSIAAHVFTVGSSGTTTVMLHNETDAVDMLTTVISIEVSESDSITSGTQPVISASNTVATADVLRFDVDSISTGAKGLEVRMTFQ